ncbi:MAG TPA: RecX family transcriptional regulator [Patescibacteria group bacterium]|nr:RecX family transcriptional regulator [Patescibacteria group bacterium]
MDQVDKYFALTLRFLAYRPRSVEEVKKNLQKKKVSSEIISIIISRLEEEHFLNDEEFARWWKEQRTKNRPHSDYFIKLELSRKGISKEIVSKIFHESDPTNSSDHDKAISLLNKYKKRFINLSPPERNKKIQGFLMRRGFNFETIKDAIDEVFGKDYNISR